MENNKEKKEKLDLMLDLETLGTKPDCVVLSVAIRSFSLAQECVPVEDVHFCKHIDALSSLFCGREIDQKTLEWWRADDRKDARQDIVDGQLHAEHFTEVMITVYGMLRRLTERYDLRIWGRGVNTFDASILDSCMRLACERAGVKYDCPWKFWQLVDLRSVDFFARECGVPKSDELTPHDAMSDVEKQIRDICRMYKHLRQGRL